MKTSFLFLVLFSIWTSFPQSVFADKEDNLNKIYLKSIVIDTSVPSNFASSLKNKRDSNDLIQVIVSLKNGHLIDPIVKACSAKGSINLSAGSYVVLCPTQSIVDLESHPSVRWLGKYDSFMKTDLLDKKRNERSNEEEYETYEVLWTEEMRKDDSKELLEGLIQDLSIDAKVRETYMKYSVVSVRHDQAELFLEKVVQLEVVHRVERSYPIRTFNSKAKAITHTGVLGQTLFSRGLNGDDQIIGISDTGLDTDHCFFYDPNFPVNHCTPQSTIEQCLSNNGHRKVVGYYDYSDSDDANGHGTHVAGTAAGNTFVKSNDQMNQNQGVAPNSKIAFFDVGLGNSDSLSIPSLDELLLLYLKEKGSSLSTHSWGSSSTSYSTSAHLTDIFIYSYPDHLVLFAAGNDGPGAKTVSGTSISKNGVSVGSTLNQVNPVVSDFSSRGPASDNRIKPDFVTPGSSILSARAEVTTQPGNCNSPSQQLVTFSGTSMATPNAAGAAALVYQYYKQGFICGKNTTLCGFSPSAALVKATLINSAQHFVAFDDPTLNIGATGFGRIQLNDTLDFNGGKLVFFDRRRLRSLQNFTTTVTPTGKGSLNIVLAWTDLPGSLSSGKVLINDLDLTVISPSGTTYNGNIYLGLPYITGRDSINNVERVLVQQIENGPYQVIVKANQLNSFYQTFSLVVNLESTVRYSSKIRGVRLADGKSSKDGRLEVLFGGDWMKVCKSKFNLPAKAICENLFGLPPSNQHFMYTQRVYPLGPNNFLEDAISCSSSETDIGKCAISPSTNTCAPNDIISIYCDCPQGFSWDGKTCVFRDSCKNSTFRQISTVSILDFTTSALSVVVPNGFTFERITVQTFMKHTYFGDLRLLLNYGATNYSMSINRGGSADNIFDGTIWTNSAPYSPSDYAFVTGVAAPTLRPEVAFPESPNSIQNQGVWTLIVHDTVSGDSGTLDGFILNFLSNCTQPIFVDCGSPAFHGPNCTTDFDECSISPCVNSTCVNTYGGYSCEIPNQGKFAQFILSLSPNVFYTFDTSSTLDISNSSNHLVNKNNSLVNFPSSTNINNKAVLLSTAPAVTTKSICHAGGFSFLVTFRSQQTISSQRLVALSNIFSNGTEIPFIALAFSSGTSPSLNINHNQTTLGKTSSTFALNANHQVMFSYHRNVSRGYIHVNGTLALNITMPVIFKNGDCYKISMARGMTNTLIDFASFHLYSIHTNAQTIYNSYLNSLV